MQRHYFNWQSGLGVAAVLAFILGGPLVAANTGDAGAGCGGSSSDLSEPEFGQSAQEAYVKSDNRWTRTNINVCWENPTNSDTENQRKGWVRDAVEDTWERYSLLDFTGWGACDANSDGIRLKISEDLDEETGGAKCWGLGSALDGLSPGCQLNFTFNNWYTACGNNGADVREACIKNHAVHEFGHAIGLSHEHNRDDTPDSCDDAPQGSDGDWTIGAWDEDSIMNYCRDDSIVCDVFGNDCEGPSYKLSDTDKDAVAAIYGKRTVSMFAKGDNWGPENYATSIAFGDVDGDGRDEIGITRKASSNGRYWIYDDAVDGYGVLFEGGGNWGSENYATSIAFGDVDGDGKDEVGITRKASSNGRYWVLDDADADFAQLLEGGSNWGSDKYATSIAFGDVDGDGRDEVGVTRKTEGNGRYWILNDANAGFSQLKEGGGSWSSSAYPTSIAFGDVDQDGKDEVGIARKAGSSWRYQILNDRDGSFAIIHEAGANWNSANYATSIAFGNIDGDSAEEVGVTRKATDNSRWYILDDRVNPQTAFPTVKSGGSNWGSSNYATSIAFGDVDSDGQDEVGIARKASDNMRYQLRDGVDGNWKVLHEGAETWGSDAYATSIAFGNIDEDGEDEFGVTRKHHTNDRAWVINYSVICRTKDLSDWDFCSESCPCTKYQGDCDSGQCGLGLSCVQDIGDDFGWTSTLDVCM